MSSKIKLKWRKDNKLYTGNTFLFQLFKTEEGYKLKYPDETVGTVVIDTNYLKALDKAKELAKGMYE